MNPAIPSSNFNPNQDWATSTSGSDYPPSVQPDAAAPVAETNQREAGAAPNLPSEQPAIITSLFQSKIFDPHLLGILLDMNPEKEHLEMVFLALKSDKYQLNTQVLEKAMKIAAKNGLFEKLLFLTIVYRDLSVINQTVEFLLTEKDNEGNYFVSDKEVGSIFSKLLIQTRKNLARGESAEICAHLLSAIIDSDRSGVELPISIFELQDYINTFVTKDKNELAMFLYRILIEKFFKENDNNARDFNWGILLRALETKQPAVLIRSMLKLSYETIMTSSGSSSLSGTRLLTPKVLSSLIFFSDCDLSVRNALLEYAELLEPEFNDVLKNNKLNIAAFMLDCRELIIKGNLEAIKAILNCTSFQKILSEGTIFYLIRDAEEHGHTEIAEFLNNLKETLSAPSPDTIS